MTVSGFTSSIVRCSKATVSLAHAGLHATRVPSALRVMPVVMPHPRRPIAFRVTPCCAASAASASPRVKATESPSISTRRVGIDGSA